MNPYGSSLTGSAVSMAGPKAIVKVSTKKPYSNDVLQHYGVKGQKWGVITKEYEPVAVDRRKLRTATPSTNTYNKLARPAPTRDRQLTAKVKKGWVTEKRERYNKAINVAGYIGTGLLLGALGYGMYKYAKITKAKAYAGSLTRFLSRNPSVNLNTESGRQLLQKGLNTARASSRGFASAKTVSDYYKSRGLGIPRKQALHIYKARNLLTRVSKIKPSSNQFLNELKNHRRNRLISRIRDKLYF